MVRSERLFLTQNTLPLFDRLLDILDGIPGEIRSRVVSPFFYAGLAHRYEDERITEAQCADLAKAYMAGWAMADAWRESGCATGMEALRRLTGGKT